ncbi:MAG: YidC/Oxa1 family membrane protein insertase [Clostridia bacterium]|nr:YidC/Oxa1 family membrane protein insertase [Clostridia bacterium]MDR3645130.1 YidC/Oxa1 family membrane protein insertase [Clostridia bacterium]
MNFFDYIILPFGKLLYYCYVLFKDYGVALLIFTFLTRVLLFPLAIKQQRSMAEMARINPRLQQVQKKYAKDKARLNEETMKLYQEEGYSPLSGCLPMLIQIPVIMILYQAILHPLKYIVGISPDNIQKIVNALNLTKTQLSRSEIYAAEAITDPTKLAQLINVNHLTFLQSVHPFNFYFFGIKSFVLTENPTMAFNAYLLIPILCYITSFLSTWLSMKMNASATPQANQGMNKSMIVMMPFVSAFFAFSVPSGLGLYWIYTNIFMIVQVLILNKFYNPVKLAEEAERVSQQKRQQRIEAEGIAPPEEEEAVMEEATQEAPSESQKKQLPARPKPPAQRPKSGKNDSKKKIKNQNKQRLAASRAYDNQKKGKDGN